AMLCGTLWPADTGKLSASKPKHVGHGIKARLLVLAPERGLHGPARENAAVFRHMGEFDSLAWPRENHPVISNHCPPPQRREADIAIATQAGVAVARPGRMLFEVDAAALCRRFAEEKRCTRRRVDLHAMVHFDDLDIKF